MDNTKLNGETRDNALDNELAAIGSQVQTDAVTMGENNLPAAVGDHMDTYYFKYHSKHQVIIIEQHKRNPVETIYLRMQQAAELAQREIQRITNALSELAQKLPQAEQKLADTPRPAPRGKFPKWATYLILGLICIEEGIFSIGVWEELFNLNHFMGICAGMGFAVLFGIYSKCVPLYIVSRPTPEKRRKTTRWVVGITIALFVAMSWCRAKHFSREGMDWVSIALNSVLFTLLSIILMGTAIALSIFSQPSAAQKEAELKYNEAKKEFDDINNEIARLKAEREAVKAQNEAVELSCREQLRNGEANEKKIMAHAHAGFNELKRLSRPHRPDRLCPDCFGEPYPFTFETYYQFSLQYFANIKTQE